jgi:putative methyltransferase
VVKSILENHPEFELAKRDSVLPTWDRRGIPEEINNEKGKKKKKKKKKKQKF